MSGLTVRRLEHLRALASGRRAPPVVEVDVNVRRSEVSRQKELRRDLAALDVEAVWMNFPRSRDLALARNCVVLLAAHRAPEPAGRERWLTAAGPQRVDQPDVVRVSLQSVVPAHHAHRWDQARWMWDRRRAVGPKWRHWKMEGLPLPLLDAASVGANVERLQAMVAEDKNNRGLLAGLSIALQDVGAWQRASSLFGVSIGPVLQSVLEGGVNEGWREAAEDILWSMALWRVGAIGVPARMEAIRLARLPPGHLADPSLVLARPKALEIVSSASIAQVPYTVWRRPLDLDELRLGLDRVQPAQAYLF